MTIQKHEFIEVSYTAKTQEGLVFDTTDKEIAQKEGLYDEKKTYGPLTLCVGEYQVVQGLDESFIGKEEKTSYSLTVEPQKAFGKKKADLIKLIPTSKFKQQGMQVAPGMQVYINNQMAVIKTVSGGRALVDFNHPLSGQHIEYEVKIGTKITDTQKQLDSLIQLQFPNSTTSINDSNQATITLAQEIPKEYTQIIEKQIKKLIPKLEKIDFLVTKPTTKKEA